MPAKARKKKRKGSPLLFLLLLASLVILPGVMVLAGLELEAAMAQPGPAESLTDTPSGGFASGEGDPASLWGAGDPSSEQPAVSQAEAGGMSLTPQELERIEAAIRASLEEAAAYVPEEESSAIAEEGTSSSQLSHFARPDVYGQQVSVYFKDLDSGMEYWYRPDQSYFVASLIKAPYSMYLYELAEQGICNLTDVITVTQEDRMEGTGILQNLTEEELPKEYTIQELLHLIIRESDNTAMKALLRVFPAAGYRAYAQRLGIRNPENIRDVTNGWITAEDAAVYLNALYEFLQNNPYGEILQEDMLHTKNPMITSSSPVVRKYGWASLSFHDMALVEAGHPYLLAILTDKDVGRQEDYRLFWELPRLFEEIMAEKYAAAGTSPVDG